MKEKAQKQYLPVFAIIMGLKSVLARRDYGIQHFSFAMIMVLPPGVSRVLSRGLSGGGVSRVGFLSFTCSASTHLWECADTKGDCFINVLRFRPCEREARFDVEGKALF